MSFVPRSIKEFGFDHQFTLSALYLEKGNSTSFAGIYKKNGKDYFCVSGLDKGFIYIPLDIIVVGRLIKDEISLLHLILISANYLLFSKNDFKSQFIITIIILYKSLFKRYNKLPNAYYFWYDFLNGVNKKNK